MDEKLRNIIPCKGLTRAHLLTYLERKGEGGLRGIAAHSDFFACPEGDLSIDDLISRCFFSYKYACMGLDWSIFHCREELEFLTDTDLGALAEKIGVKMSAGCSRASYMAAVWWWIEQQMDKAFARLKHGSHKDVGSVRLVYEILQAVLSVASLSRRDLMDKLASRGLGEGYWFSENFLRRFLQSVTRRKDTDIVYRRQGSTWVFAKGAK